ncbi:MAG: hypothetical protein QXJ06_00015 [Candidatus Aenigmatarchaeota archaeon]
MKFKLFYFLILLLFLPVLSFSECIESSCRVICGSSCGCCNNECVDLNTDENNCGQCGKVCSANQQCQFGNCVAQIIIPSTQTTPRSTTPSTQTTPRSTTPSGTTQPPATTTTSQQCIKL